MQSFKYNGKRVSTAEVPVSIPQATGHHPISSALSDGSKRVRIAPTIEDTTQSKHASSTDSSLPPELLGDAPLRAIIVGHNPSETAWRLGHYYANPSNWMWRILHDTGIAPKQHIRGCEDDSRMPSVAGVGFVDVGSGHPGTDSSKFKASHFAQWRQPFYDKLNAHAARAAKSLGCTCGRCGVPLIVAFSGKRQFAELFPQSKLTKVQVDSREVHEKISERSKQGKEDSIPHVKTQVSRPKVISIGRQAVVPDGWPLPLDLTEVWVMSSTSGAAPMTRAERYSPWVALAGRLAHEPWPRHNMLRCGTIR